MQMKIGILPQIIPAWLNSETLVFNLQSSEEKNVKKCIIMQDKNRSTESVRSQYFTTASSPDCEGSSFSSFWCRGCLWSEKL